MLIQERDELRLARARVWLTDNFEEFTGAMQAGKWVSEDVEKLRTLSLVAGGPPNIVFYDDPTTLAHAVARAGVEETNHIKFDPKFTLACPEWLEALVKEHPLPFLPTPRALSDSEFRNPTASLSRGSSCAHLFMLWAMALQSVGSRFDRRDLAVMLLTKAAWGWVETETDLHVLRPPQSYHVDAKGRLDSLDGTPSVVWANGDELFHVSDRPVPRWVIHPTASDILAAATGPEMLLDLEVALERFGWANAVRLFPSKVIDTSSDPQWGSLIDLIIPPLEACRVLLCMCGTGREVALPVPAWVETVDQAQLALVGSGVDPIELKKGVRT